MIKKITLLFYLINVCACLAQTGYQTSIDTADVAYRSKLTALYNGRTAQTLLSFKDFPERSVRRTLIESYSELNSEFITKVNGGQFVQAPYYEGRINALLQQIAAANPQYTALSSTQLLFSFADVPNAYAIGDGFVVVTIPLLANLKKEQELAFVLCHEIAHNLLEHPKHGLLEYAKIQASSEIKKQTREIEKRKYNKRDDASSLYQKIIYSDRKKHREVEFQADSLGFVLYRNAFPGKESVAVENFTTLGNMDREKDSLKPADYEKLFSSNAQPFKKEWILNDEITAYRYDKTPKFWQIDSLKTHPDCADRANRLKTLFKITPQNSTETDSAYRQVIQHAAYDQLLGLYTLKEYGKSLYGTLLLLKDNPQDTYLRNMAHSNLVKIQESQKNYTMNKYVEIMSPRYSYSYNTFLSFLRQLRKSEMTEIINQYSIKI